MGFFSFLFGKNFSIGEGRITDFDRAKLRERWLAVEQQRALGKPSTLKIAVLDADKVLGDALAIIYPRGANMFERMKLAKDRFPERRDYDDLWYAHKVRNVIAHESSYDLPGFEAGNVLDKYRKCLLQLGAL
jgi:hypothetical protein